MPVAHGNGLVAGSSPRRTTETEVRSCLIGIPKKLAARLVVSLLFLTLRRPPPTRRKQFAHIKMRMCPCPLQSLCLPPPPPFPPIAPRTDLHITGAGFGQAAEGIIERNEPGPRPDRSALPSEAPQFQPDNAGRMTG
ncbi:hypothetical protein BaRGS_00003102 [Batillaria attramentaria]|uniref:Uncharacterized protein n=1 Tax=Batillaria attramentaria TaxID=370345 RepID=A0ABD0M3E2_9CAEN